MAQQLPAQCSFQAGCKDLTQLILIISIRSYDSNLNVSRDDKKNKFASTMEFVEDYLNNVVSEAVPFANEEKNKLTFEVRVLMVSLARCRVQQWLAVNCLLMGWLCWRPYPWVCVFCSAPSTAGAAVVMSFPRSSALPTTSSTSASTASVSFCA